MIKDTTLSDAIHRNEEELRPSPGRDSNAGFFKLTARGSNPFVEENVGLS